MIPMRVSGSEQQEIVRLLCRVHQLEIENMESQSANLMRDFHIKRKDMVIAKHRHNKNLADEIIRRQRDLLSGIKRFSFHPMNLFFSVRFVVCCLCIFVLFLSILLSC